LKTVAGVALSTLHVIGLTRRDYELRYGEWVAALVAQTRGSRHTIRNCVEGIALATETIAAESHASEADARSIRELAYEINRQADTFFGQDPMTSYLASRAAPLKRLIESVAREYMALRSLSSVTVKCEGTEDTLIPAAEVEEMLRRILENAAQAGAQSALIQSCRCDGLVQIRVSNDGPRIPDQTHRELFRRGGGGFWVARRIVVLLGGDIKLETTDVGHTCFIIEFYPPAESGT
jgi:signal transduction histidine kinase